MAETTGGNIGSGAGEYRPRHAADQMDDGFMEVLADAADQYRYRQMYEQYDAEFAIIRARLFASAEVGEDDEFITSQRQRIAESIGRQAAAKTYADELRAQLYYVPPDDERPYRGRHRLEDRQEEVRLPHYSMEDRQQERQARLALPDPRPPRPQSQEPLHGRLRHIIDDEELPAAPAEGHPPEQAPPVPVPEQKERGLMAKLRHVWYAGAAAVGAFFAHPEKGERRRAVVRTAAVLGSVASVLLIAELADHAPDHIVQPPPMAEPAGPPPNTEAFFDTIQPHKYSGEPYEWTVAANHVGAPEATPKLLRLIEYARGNGLSVDTWGDPDSGRWGISSVTVHLPDGAEKSYYDTPRKLAIMQWYAGGAAQGPQP